MRLTFWKWRAALVAILTAAGAPIHAATFVVTNNADHGPGSLRDAIGMANVNGVDDIITFAPALAGATITLSTGELQIDEASSLTLTADGLSAAVTISGNRVTRVLDVFFGASVILDSLVIADGLDDYGSGILSEGSLTLRRCLIARNVARHGSGGGLYQYGAFLTIDRTTFTENVCVGDSDASGAGGYLAAVSADIINSTFSGNCAAAALGTANGGGLFQSGGGISIRHCTFAGNRARGLSSYGGALLVGGLVNSSHTIFAGNEALFGPEIYSGVAAVDSAGYNLLGNGANVLGITNGVNGDRVGTPRRPLDPGLGPLQYNGGLAPTHAPLACSPVIDAAPDSFSAPETDQRGFPRLVDGNGFGNARLDLGAVEAGPSIFVTTPSDSSDGLHSGGVSLREALANATPGARVLFDPAGFAQLRVELDPSKGPLTVHAGNVTLDASSLPGPMIVSGQNAGRVFDVAGGAVLTLTQIRVEAGRAGAGAGLRCAAGGTVNLDHSIFASCIASNGGGAILNAGVLVLHGCQLLNNTTLRGHGGALHNTNAGSAELFNCIIADNVANAGNGGGIYNGSGATLSIVQSAVQHNSASGSGGGIHNGGTNLLAATLLRYATIVHNTAGLDGGGVANSSVLRTTHTLFASNRRGSVPNDFAGSASSDGYNLVGTVSGANGFNGSGEVKNVDPSLRAVNVPSGLLYAPESDSPAVDAGFNTASHAADALIPCGSLPSLDLAGLSRAVKGSDATGVRVDIGALEFQVQHSFATNSAPWPIPGRIEAEDFDAGGEGIAYSETTPQNVPGAYRPDDGVDIEPTTDAGGGFDITGTVSGEWIRYSVEVQESGPYTLLLRVASDASSGTLRVEIDGVDKTGDMTIPGTGGAQDWATFARTGIELTAGRHVLRLVWGDGTVNLNYLEWRSDKDARGLTRLLYLNRGGASVANFYPQPRGQAGFPANAEPFGDGVLESGRVSEFETPSDVADNYGVILTGAVVPSQSGYYSFYLCADNEGELWLSSDADPAHATRIATEPQGNPSRTWVDGAGRPAVDGRPSNVSAPIFLEACRSYYVEAIMKESDGSDNLGVAWQPLGDPAPANGAPPVGTLWLRPFLSLEKFSPVGSLYTVGSPEVVPSFQTILPNQPGAFAEFRVLSSTRGPVTYEWQLNGLPLTGTNYSGDGSAVLKISDPGLAQAGSYSVVLRGPSDTNVSVPVLLAVQSTVSPDNTAPTVAVLSPAAAVFTTTSSEFTFMGAASDDRRVLAVLVSGDGFTNRPAAGTTNWSFATPLVVGMNRFAFRAVDASGNLSLPASRSIILPDTNRLGLMIVGQGTVVPNLTNAPLVAGRVYKLIATPQTGFVFAGWTGDIASTSNALSFRMTPGLALQARFVPNPFASQKGAYNGLFYEPTEIRHETSGFITASVTDHGAFSGRLTLAGKAVPFSGRFTPGGVTQLRLPRRGSNPLTLELRLSADGAGQFVGGLTDGSWVAEVLADRASFSATNPAPSAGRHTLVLSASGNSGEPGGDSVGAALLAASGKVSFGGTLADGTAVSQGTFISREGDWPFYAALYCGKGSIIGWLTFVTNSPTESLGGRVSWIKPPSCPAKAYTNGFMTESWMLGSTYQRSTTNRLLTFSNGVVQLTGGDLASSPLLYNVGLTMANRIAHTNGPRFTLSLSTANGLFTGGFTPPGRNVGLKFRGALLQQRDAGSGFFLNKKVSGKVQFDPAP